MAYKYSDNTIVIAVVRSPKSILLVLKLMSASVFLSTLTFIGSTAFKESPTKILTTLPLLCTDAYMPKLTLVTRL